jgi:MFS superfamily sulfate permease-like transporter
VSRTVLPVTDLVDVEPAALRADVLPALAVAAMSVPQGLAWALVAGLPPALGLWAATVPTVVAALARSSRTTVVGPTNAMCVLLATTLAGEVDPAAAAAALACWVGVLQLGRERGGADPRRRPRARRGGDRAGRGRGDADARGRAAARDRR